MKAPGQDVRMDEANREEMGWLRRARGLLFGIGGFDGNASLAVLGASLEDEIAAGRATKIESPNPTNNDDSIPSGSLQIPR